MKVVAINSSGGGSDKGVTGNGLVEKNVTLELSNKIKDILESNGVEVFMMRSDDSTKSYDERINELKSIYKNPNDVIVLSNTLNSGGNSGIEIIYSINSKDTLAKMLDASLSNVNTTNYYQYRWPTDTTKDYYYITRNTPGYETIIIRYGYVDNSKDANILKNNLNELASSVATSILNYLGISNIKEPIQNSDSKYYIVSKGDTLYGIAKKYNTTVDKLKVMNNLSSNLINVGQKLLIDNNTYKVVSGDTLYSIAKKYNVSLDELKKANNKNSNLINVGELLIIP